MGKRHIRLVRRTIIGAWLLLGVTVGRAVPPASVEDTLYTELQFAGSTRVLTYYHLGAGGVARKLFSVANGSGTGFLDVFGPSEQFNYVYTPPTGAAPTQATIQFTGGAVTADFSRQLAFTTAESTDGTFGATSSFSLASRTGLSGALNVSNRLWIHPGELNITGFVLA